MRPNRAEAESVGVAGQGDAVAKLQVLDLFSGIGGFALGLDRAGFKTAAFCEISPKCRHLLKTHWPEVPIYDDVCGLTAERLRADGITVDVICGGFPCQDLSFAGKGAGLEGERSGLWREYARIIREFRPRFVIVENVAALLSRGLGVVLGDLARLGYDAVWDRVRAFDVGAPHLRARLWIVAYARGEQHEGFGHAFGRSFAEGLLEAALANSGYAGHGAEHVAGQDPGAPEPDQGQGHQRQRLRPIAGRSRKAVANADDLRKPQPQGRESDLGGRPCNGGEQISVADASGIGRGAMEQPIPRRAEGQGPANPSSDTGFPFGRGWWATEPDVGRVAHGVPARVDRLHGLGNAVVPQIIEVIGRAILAAERERLSA